MKSEFHPWSICDSLEDIYHIFYEKLKNFQLLRPFILLTRNTMNLTKMNPQNLSLTASKESDIFS